MIEFKSFSLYRKKNLLLKAENLTIEENKKVSLFADNGRGKTTFLNCLLGKYPDYEGEIYINKKSLKKHSLKELATIISWLPSFNPENSYLCNKEVISLGLKRETIDFSMREKIIHYFNLENLLEKKFGESSGGEKKKILLLRCLSQKASLYLLDEPLNFLDQVSKIKFFSLLFELERTIIFSNHDWASTLFFSREVLYVDSEKRLKRDFPEKMVQEKFFSDEGGRGIFSQEFGHYLIDVLRPNKVNIENYHNLGIWEKLHLQKKGVVHDPQSSHRQIFHWN